MNQELQSSIIVMVAVVCLPVLPAFLLFKFLPSAGSAQGPLHGGKIRFTGAFAGYLVVFLSLLYVRPTESKHFHTWTVEGRVVFEQAPGEPEPNVNDVVARAVPPRLAVLNGGGFLWDVYVVESDDGRMHFPDLQFDLRGHRGMTLALGPNRTYGSVDVAPEYDMKHRRITFTKPITMQSLAVGKAYFGSKAQEPTPVEIGK